MKPLCVSRRIDFCCGARTLYATRVMISGRCSLLSTIRYVSELSKKGCSTGVHGRAGSYLTESAQLSVVERRANR